MASVRASEDTREETVARLRRGYLSGRLRTDTFARRIDGALHAESHEELRGLTADIDAPTAPPRRPSLRDRLRPPRLGLPPAGELLGARLVVGRSRRCELVLADDTVSRRHAELRAEGGRWIVRDLGSSNGTYVNGRLVGEAEVRPGDAIRLGGCELRL